MKIVYVLGLFLLAFISCDQEALSLTIPIYPAKPPVLKLSNQLEENYSITSWKMDGYEFTELNIPPGGTEQFLLNNGMRNGYKNIDVTVFLSSSSRSFAMHIKVSFESGSITTITVLSEDQIESKW